MPSCTRCGATIDFYVTSKGNKMPVDRAPHPEGNVVVEGDSVRVLRRGEDVDAPRYRCHMDTCPARKGGGTSRPAGGRHGQPYGRRGGAPPPHPPVVDSVEAVRSTIDQILAEPDPVLTAHTLLAAAAAVLRRKGRSADELRDLVSR